MSRFPSLSTLAGLALLSLMIPVSEAQAGGWYSPCGSYCYSYWPGSYVVGYSGYCGTYTPYYRVGYCPTYTVCAPAPCYTTYAVPVCRTACYRPTYGCYLSAPYSVGYYSPWCGTPYPSPAYYGSFYGCYGYGGYGYPAYGCRW